MNIDDDEIDDFDAADAALFAALDPHRKKHGVLTPAERTNDGKPDPAGATEQPGGSKPPND